MIDLSAEIQAILSAVYAKDVRAAIVSAITKTGEAAPGELKTELEDIRTGADGTAYESAGEAVREQVSALREDLDEAGTELEDIRTGAGGIEYASAGEAVRTQIQQLTDNVNEAVQRIGEGVDAESVLLESDPAGEDLLLDLGEYLDNLESAPLAVKTFGDHPTSGDCYIGAFVPCDSETVWALKTDDSTTRTTLSTGYVCLCCYDARKNYIGIQTKSVAAIQPEHAQSDSKHYHLSGYWLPDGTAYIRLYARKNIDSAYRSVRIYTSPVRLFEKKHMTDDVKTLLANELGVSSCLHTNLAYNPFLFTIYTAEPEIFGTAGGGLALGSLIPCDHTIYLNVKPADGKAAWYVMSGRKYVLFDADKHVIAVCDTNNGLVSNELITAEYTDAWEKVSSSAVMGLKISTAENVKYIRFAFNNSYATIDDITNSLVISNTKLDITAKPTDKFFYSEVLENAIEGVCATFAAKNSYYKFKKVGTLFTPPADYRYNCHMQECMHYDISDDTYVCAVRTAVAHGGAAGKLYFVKLDAQAKTEKSATYLEVGGAYIGWAQGFAIKSDGTYILIARYFDGSDTDSVHQFTSTDKGATWTDNGAVKVTDSDTATYQNGSNGHTYDPQSPSARFFSIHMLSSGRLLGVYDDTVLGVNCRKSTGEFVSKIAYSDDDGKTWTVVTVDSATDDTCEQTFIEINDTIVAYCRQNAYNQTASCYLMYSTDSGASWTAPVKSNTLLKMCCSDACGFTHDNIVELFTINRTSNANCQKNSIIKAGAMYHYTATLAEALNDKYTLREVFYSRSNASSDFTAPACAVDCEDRVLVAYPESQRGNSTPTQWNFLERYDYDA